MPKPALILRFSVILSVIFGLSSTSYAQFYNGSQQEFGKNRVQYEEFYWQYYSYEEYDVYFYKGGQELAEYVAKVSVDHIKELEEMLDFYMDEKVEFLVYTSQSDFKQSNIGLTGDDQYNIGGVTRIVGSKVFLYYDGDHAGLDEQIRAGVAEVLVNQMMYGGNWRDVIKNSTLLTLPEWYLQGFISYASKGWDVDIDNRVRDGVLNGEYDKFNKLEGVDAVYAGHAIWNYVAEVYGEKVIPHILYMARVSRNVESGFLYVLGTSLKTLSVDYIDYYSRKYETDEKFRSAPTEEELEIKTKDSRVYYQFKISPDGSYAAFCSNELGQWKVWLYEFATGKTKKVHKGDHKLNRITDYTFPVLTWHPTSAAFTFVTEEKGEVLLNIYTLEKGKTDSRPLNSLDKVLSLEYSPDGRNIIFSAAKDGQTDLYLYQVIGNAQKQLTFDIFDDLYPSFVDNGTRIIFSSNRYDDTLRSDDPIATYPEDLDVFIYTLDGNSLLLERVTNTPDINETEPTQYDDKHYTFLSDQSGVTNRYAAYLDSTISHIDTAFHYRYFTKSFQVSNYPRNVLEYEVVASTGYYSMLMFSDGEYKFLRGNLANDVVMANEGGSNFIESDGGFVENNPFLDQMDQVEITEYAAEADDKDEVDINNYTFQDDGPTYEKETITITNDPQDQVDEGDTIEFVLAEQRLYKLNFATDYVVTQVDNNFLNTSYQRFTGGPFYNPNLNGLIELGVSDLFEDHKIVGGFRLAGDLNSNEYLLTYQDLKDRVDKLYLLHRQSFLGFNGAWVVKVHTHEAKYGLRFPFNEVSSLRGTFSYRNDKQTTLSVDFNSLQEPEIFNNMVGFKLEYVFDNARSIGLNLWNGMRFKVFGEAYQEVTTAGVEDIGDVFAAGDFFVVGLDFRHYTKVHRNIVWANRIAASTSFGSRKLLYYMGGVDNWLFPQFNNDVAVDLSQNYFYQTIATPMRGFNQNARNGNSFILINSELRVPIFKYLINRPLKSDFLENFQVVGFGDVGTAWTGPDPYSQDNAFNIQSVNQHPVYVTLYSQREPVIGGFGWGLRSRLFGYFIRFDWAFGIDDGQIANDIKYVSLSLDF